MAQFLEERLPVTISYGSSFGELYQVEIVETDNGHEYRRLVHNIPRMVHDISYAVREQIDLLESVLDLYHRCYGRFAGFRVKNLAYYSTNNYVDTPTPFDCALDYVSAGVYQLVAYYGNISKPVLDIGRPKRTIFKPVSGTVKIGIQAVEQTQGWTVDTTTGRITFAANKTGMITNITQAASAVVTLGAHTFVVNDTVHFTGVVGMTEINGMRGTITAKDATTITVDIDTTLYTAYTSGGTVNTRPQTGETVYGGCEYDIPCRWDSDLSDITYETFNLLGIGNMKIKEILNP